VASGRIQLTWISTTQQLADVLTKALGSHQHRALSNQLMILNPSQAQAIGSNLHH